MPEVLASRPPVVNSARVAGTAPSVRAKALIKKYWVPFKK